MKNSSSRQRGLWAFVVACLLVLVLTTVYGDAYVTRLVMRVMVLSIVVSSLNLLIGYSGLVSFGHAAFFGLGAYATAILGLNGYASAGLVWPAAMLAAGLGAAIVGVLALRTTGSYFIMVTLAFAQMIYYVFAGLDQYGGDDGLRIATRNTFGGLFVLSDQRVFLWVIACLFALVLFGTWRLVNARFGRVLMGIKDNERRMQSLGYDTRAYKLAAFILAGCIAGLGGALTVNLNEQASPSMLHWIFSGDLLIMAVLGGVGTIVGPVFGVAAFIVLEESLSGITRHWMAILGPLMLLVILFQRGGIAGLFARGKSNNE